MSLGPSLRLLRLLLLVFLFVPHRSVSPLRCLFVWPGGGIAIVSPFWTPVPTPRAVARGGGGWWLCQSSLWFGAAASLEPKLKNLSSMKKISQLKVMKQNKKKSTYQGAKRRYHRLAPFFCCDVVAVTEAPWSRMGVVVRSGR